MKNLTLLQFGAVMASTTLQVDAERLLTDDGSSPCHGNQRIYWPNKKTGKFQTSKNLTKELNKNYGKKFTIAAAKYDIITLGTWRVKLACSVFGKHSALILKGVHHEKRCDQNNLVFQSPRNTEDMYNFSSTPKFFRGRVKVPCNYSRGTFTWLTCRDGEVLPDRVCAQEQPCDKNNLVFELPSNIKAMYDLSSIDNIFRGRVHVLCNYSRRGKSTFLTCRNGEVKPNFDCPEIEDMPCDKNNLNFQFYRNDKEMYTFSSKDNIFRGRAQVSCNYNMGKKTWLMCQDGEVLPNYDCTETEQEWFGERLCPPAERVAGDPHLDFAHGCNWMVSGERTFRCKHPNADGSYSYNTVYGMGEGDDLDVIALEPDQEPEPTNWKAKKAVCPQQ